MAISEQEFNLKYLEAELARLDVVLRRQVLLWRRAGRDPADVYRGLYVSDADAEALLRRPLGTHWGQFISLAEDEARQFDRVHRQAQSEIERLRSRAEERGVLLRLEHLRKVFGLTDFEIDAFLIALAPSLDERYERVYGYLHDDVTRKRASAQLVLDLLGEPGSARLDQLQPFAEGQRLMRNRLLRYGGQSADQLGGVLSRPLQVEGPVLRWLLGHYQPGPVAGGHLRFSRPQPDPLERSRAGPALEQSRTTLDQATPPILALTGPDGLAHEAVARQLAAASTRPLLRFELDPEPSVSLDEILAVVRRDALLTDALIHISGLQQLQQVDPMRRALTRLLTAEVGPVLLSGTEEWLNWSEIVQGQRCLVLECALPPVERRLELWQAELEARGAAANGSLGEVAAQFQLSSAKIHAAAQRAVDHASQRGGEVERADLFAAARSHSNPKLAELATKVEPRYSWDDLILPDDQLAMLRELVATVRQRHQVLDLWGVGEKLVSGRGVRALFAGPPGTGKTMAAGILAGELGLDLYKIDLSTVVSKYIGETEKNLEKVFAEASTSNAILFFDEADALFGKRSEVRDSHDRYANLEISYLLQRMESYDGVTILATNLRANLDDAFTRRLDFAVDFPFPEEEDRLRIWRTLLPAGVPRADELDLEYMSREYKLAGGNIRNVLVSAAYLAAADGGRVTMEHLQHGARRELQKMGRLPGSYRYESHS